LPQSKENRGRRVENPAHLQRRTLKTAGGGDTTQRSRGRGIGGAFQRREALVSSNCENWPVKLQRQAGRHRDGSLKNLRNHCDIAVGRNAGKSSSILEGVWEKRKSDPGCLLLCLQPRDMQTTPKTGNKIQAFRIGAANRKSLRKLETGLVGSVRKWEWIDTRKKSRVKRTPEEKKRKGTEGEPGHREGVIGKREALTLEEHRQDRG